MNPVLATAYFMALFLALASLLRWRYRRVDSYHRLRQGLRTYAALARSQSDQQVVLMPQVRWHQWDTLRAVLSVFVGLE